jgi:pimeloyl-ACP methyl ester carboxylesterase
LTRRLRGSLHPQAQRGLLIDYGSWGDGPTGEAIFRAMALRQIDYYAIRPTRAPDELFHQSISTFLLEWSHAQRFSSHTAHIVGESWTGRAHELREVLGRCALPHAFCLADSPEGQELLAAVDEKEPLPLVIFPNGEVLRDPSMRGGTSLDAGGSHPRRLLGVRLRVWISLNLAVLLFGCGQSCASQPQFRALVRTASIHGTTIAWYQRGRGAPLLMLTGTGSTMSEWDPALLRLLARGHRLILFDYPGVGRSGPWRGRTFDSLAQTTANLMKALHLAKADVLGWSMGGFVAQRLAIDHPGRVAHLILAATNPGGSHAVLGLPRAQAIDSEPDPPLNDILHELYPPDRQGEARRFLHRLARASRSGEIPDDFHVAAKTTRLQVAAEDPWLRSNANYRRLGGVRIPTLAAAGSSDPVTPAVNMRLIANRLPQAVLRVLPGAHAFLFQEREHFVGVLERFLEPAES